MTEQEQKLLEIRVKELEMNNKLLWVYVKTLKARLDLLNATMRLEAAFENYKKTK